MNNIMIDYIIGYFIFHIMCYLMTLLIYIVTDKVTTFTPDQNEKLVIQSLKYGPLALIVAIYYAIKT